MSDEEQIQTEEKHCKCKIFATMVVLSFLFSIAAFIMSFYALNGGELNIGSNDSGKIVISKQYDKGRSYAKAIKTNKPVVMLFYTDWCQYCQRFIKTFDAVTKDSKIKRNFAVAYVNCEKEESRALMRDFDVHGFPTVFVFDNAGRKLQLENRTFFKEDAKDTMIKNILGFIGE